MKLVLVIGALLMAATINAAEVPSLEIYKVFKGDGYNPLIRVVLELNNHTKKTFYLNAASIEDVNYAFQQRKGTKWKDIPIVHTCGNGLTYYPLYSGKSLLFTVYPDPGIETNKPWRVVAYIYASNKFDSPSISVYSPSLSVDEELLAPSKNQRD